MSHGINLIHDTSHLFKRFRIDGIKAMLPGISGGNEIRVIVIDFSYSFKTKGRFNSRTKFKVRVSKFYVTMACCEDIFDLRSTLHPNK